MANSDDIMRLFESFGQSASRQGYRSFHRDGGLQPAGDGEKPAAYFLESAQSALPQARSAVPAGDFQRLAGDAQAMNDATVNVESPACSVGQQTMDAAANHQVTASDGQQTYAAETSSPDEREATPLRKIFERLLAGQR